MNAHWYSASEFWYILAAGLCLTVAWLTRRHFARIERDEAIAHRYSQED